MKKILEEVFVKWFVSNAPKNELKTAPAAYAKHTFSEFSAVDPLPKCDVISFSAP